MGSAAVTSSSSSSDAAISGKFLFLSLREKEVENLTLTSQPLNTLSLFGEATFLYIKRSVLYLLAHGGWFILLTTLLVAFGVLLVTVDGPHGKHVEEVSEYVRYSLWWIALGVASSIGLGSGLHTFVLYLGPHIALFTLKATQCGRIDLKSAPYDTIQFKRVPSWLEKSCSEFGPPLMISAAGSRVPLTSILPQIQLEAILWGYWDSSWGASSIFHLKGSLSGSRVDGMEELEASPSEDMQVPNPLFDLAGIMCGQFGIPFWEFFLATLIGKAIIKTHIQTIFIICVCNNQLLDWMENEMIWILSHVPGLADALPGLIAKLHAMKEKYIDVSPPVPSHIKVKKWDFSFASIWKGIVWLMLLN
ncbi:BnaAnng10310D [Brassica napus]|uniref:BnaAnng10310D protein n=1 Tax=Brassica napus TaxID=3708 RepID=A0A078IK38_BRANA|nr:BnaAnng10310D [Brassica napus]